MRRLRLAWNVRSRSGPVFHLATLILVGCIGAVAGSLAGCAADSALNASMDPPIDTDRISRRVADAVADATGSALQGDAASSLNVLTAVPRADYTGDALVFRDCMVERFGADAPPPVALGDDPWITALGRAYIDYWRKTLTRSAAIAAAEDDLAASVGQLISRRMARARELDDREPAILAAVEAHGLHALLGRTAPLRELMLWRKQTVLERAVDLPGGREQVTVMLLDDFLAARLGTLRDLRTPVRGRLDDRHGALRRGPRLQESRRRRVLGTLPRSRGAALCRQADVSRHAELGARVPGQAGRDVAGDVLAAGLAAAVLREPLRLQGRSARLRQRPRGPGARARAGNRPGDALRERDVAHTSGSIARQEAPGRRQPRRGRLAARAPGMPAGSPQ